MPTPITPTRIERCAGSLTVARRRSRPEAVPRSCARRSAYPPSRKACTGSGSRPSSARKRARSGRTSVSKASTSRRCAPRTSPFAAAVVKAVLVDRERLRVRGLDVHHGLDHRVDLALDVVRLIDHERRRGLRLRKRDLAHDAEQLERIDRPDDQVVVGVLAVVEVEAAEQALATATAPRSARCSCPADGARCRRAR